jgi:hypothetical protein
MYSCLICGKKFEKGKSLSAHTSHHSNKRNKNKKIKIIKQCKVCGIDFEVERTINKKGEQHIPKKEKTCCSSKCSHSIGGNCFDRTKTKKANCKTCGKEINVFTNNDINNVNCTKCRKLHYISYSKKTYKDKKIYKKICKWCNKEFETKNNKTKFCSLSCGGKFSATIRVRRSRNEIVFAELCKQHFNTVKTNENLFNGWDADIIIEDKKIAVLWNGPWHYKKLMKGHSLEQVQNRDRIKIKEIIKCGYTPYEIKDDSISKEWSRKEVVEREFNKFLEFCSSI